MLEIKINESFLDNYKNKNEAVINVLRMVKASILNKKIEKKMSKDETLTDEEVIAVLKSEMKKRKDSLDAYLKANRTDLAVIEEAEIKIINDFLPAQISEEQIREIVKKVIVGLGNPGQSEFGRVVGQAMKEVGSSADGGVVAKLVREELLK